MSTDNHHEVPGPNGHMKAKPGGAYPKRHDLPSVIKEHLDQVAKRLPLFPEEYDAQNTVTGFDLIQQGVSEIKQKGLIKPVEIGKEYALPTVALRTIDHKLKLRQFWRAGGLLGCHEYLNMLPAYIEQMQGMYPTLFKDGTFLGVEEGTQLTPNPEYLEKIKANAERQAAIKQN